MAADRARADEEDLKVSPFQKGEWEQTRPTELDVDYALLAEALGPAGAPVAEIHDATVVALAYVTGELAGALLGTVDDVLTKYKVQSGRLRSPRFQPRVPIRISPVVTSALTNPLCS